ncbi:AI-2E family transporter [Hahella sp. CCB-MM4]|uniref:AI-2E family transporter n=1 Tax=Hahella sp. (strain CCB-MM4) TaxID=1926491 RepID=UPI000B9B1B2F|nr:AI-2E family transporter [Hahella sp. CCB-MM4]OZG71854.1 AI-2E family transporter [Hahella sp. CCB-MM4]
MTKKLEDGSFLILLVAVSIGFGMMIMPFFSAIFWAAVLVILFSPLHRFLTSKLNQGPSVSALISLVASLLIVVIPVSLIVAMLGVELADLYQGIKSGDIPVQVWVDKLKSAIPVVQELAERFDIDLANINKQLSSAALAASKVFASQAVSVGQEYVNFLINFVLMLYLTFFFLRDGDSLIQLMIRALPLGDDRERHLLGKFAEVSRAVVKGNLVVATVQGALGGIIFGILGLPGAVLWGVVMVILSLLPAVGSALVWGPAAAFLLISGQYVSGIILVLFGIFVIGLVDNVLRPILVGRDTKMPDFMVLLSTLGGIGLFGLNGFVIGPILAALFLAFWQIFMDEFNPASDEDGAAELLITGDKKPTAAESDGAES